MTSQTPISRLVLAKQSELDNADPESTVLSVSSYSPFVQLSTVGGTSERTAGQCLALSEFDWMADIPTKSYEECASFLDAIAEWVVPISKTALQLFEESQWVSTGLAELDALLHGGLRAGHLVEIVGRAGLGKSQFCMTVAAKLIQQQKRGVIYLDSERKFSQERLAEILVANGGSAEDASHVYVLRADEMNFVEFRATLKQLELELMEKNAGLIVVDSIAAISRVESVSVVERQSNLARVATELKQIAETFRIPVVVTNQVMSSHVAGGSNASGSSFVSLPSATTTAPALGNTWHHVVNMRIQLSSVSEDGPQHVREMRVTKSPDSIEAAVQFMVGTAGIVSSRQASAIKEWADVLSGLSPAELSSF